MRKAVAFTERMADDLLRINKHQNINAYGEINAELQETVCCLLFFGFFHTLVY
ncbi:hypothetical protein [Sphingobacterium siyangense]|uniref:hypothetical protein n=1 Tax=Sphingobacterium siyangense TaxID=459529 RepID=UPI0031F9FE21